MTDGIVCYTDGSCGTFCAGIGYEIRGDVEQTGSRPISDNITSMEAELYAVLEAVRVAKRDADSHESITIYTDCRPLARKLRASNDERDDWHTYQQSAHWLLDKFDSWEVRHCSREQTQVAHDLAKNAFYEAQSKQ